MADDTLAMVFSGGGARGMFQVGVYEVLAASDLYGRPQVLSGTSAGAINAALVAAGRDASALRRFWLSLGEHPPVAPNRPLFRALLPALARIAFPARDGAGLLRSLLSLDPLRDLVGLLRRGSDHVADHVADAAHRAMTSDYDHVVTLLARVQESHVFGTTLRERLVAELGCDAVRTVGDVALAVSVVDAYQGRVIRYHTRETAFTESHPEVYEHTPEMPVDVLCASASIPLLFPAVQVSHGEGHRTLAWDGGILVNTPLAPAVDLGADRIVTVLATTGAAPRAERFDSLGSALERLADTFLENTYNVDAQLLTARSELGVAERDAEERSANEQGRSSRARAADWRPRNRVVSLLEPIRPNASDVFGAGSYLDFRPASLDRMYEAGREAARAWLTKAIKETPVVVGGVV